MPTVIQHSFICWISFFSILLIFSLMVSVLVLLKWMRTLLVVFPISRISTGTSSNTLLCAAFWVIFSLHLGKYTPFPNTLPPGARVLSAPLNGHSRPALTQIQRTDMEASFMTFDACRTRPPSSVP